MGWRLRGFDTFAGESYDLDGEYGTEQEALKAAFERFVELEQTQPTTESGGQGLGGIQDRVILVDPFDRGRLLVPSSKEFDVYRKRRAATMSLSDIIAQIRRCVPDYDFLDDGQDASVLLPRAAWKRVLGTLEKVEVSA